MKNPSLEERIRNRIEYEIGKHGAYRGYTDASEAIDAMTNSELLDAISLELEND